MTIHNNKLFYDNQYDLFFRVQQKYQIIIIKISQKKSIYHRFKEPKSMIF